MGISKDYLNVPDWIFKSVGYEKGQRVKYQGNIFVANSKTKLKPGEGSCNGWEFVDELYDITANVQSQVSKVIAYLSTSPQSASFPYNNPSTYQFVSHVILAFLMFNLQNLGQFDPNSLNSVNGVISDVVTSAKQSGAKVMISIGGPNDCQFTRLLSVVGKNKDHPLVKTAALNIFNFVNNNNLDGVDLDLACWIDKKIMKKENIGGRTINQGPHKAGYGLKSLAQALRALMPDKLITAAFPGSSWYGNNFDPSIYQYLDWIGLKTYDFTGPWDSSPVGPHTELFKIKNQSIYIPEQQGKWPGGGIKHNPIFSTEESLWYWTNRFYSNGQGNRSMIPRSRIVLGIPLYGYDFSYAEDPDPVTGIRPIGYHKIPYSTIINSFGSEIDSSGTHVLIN